MSKLVELESHDGQHQVTVDGVLQMTVHENGIVTIDLASKALEVERDMPSLRLTIRPGARFAYMAPELLRDKAFVDDVLAREAHK